MISTVILKPTKECNADCSYCSSPPSENNYWSVRDFEKIIKSVAGRSVNEVMFIWHGGEPMLLGPDFYRACYKVAQKYKPNIRFAIQTNLTLYKSSRWKEVFRNVFHGRVSTSYDPDEESRTIKGSTTKYNAVFRDKLNTVISDGYSPLVVGTYSDETIDLAHSVYNDSIKRGDEWFDFRVNHRYPAGRAEGGGELISPRRYGEVLIELYDRWIIDKPKFVITPLDQMLKLTLGLSGAQCPWTRRCGGRFLGIEPNGDVYNCADFADLGEDQYKYGNIFDGTIGNVSGVVNFYKKEAGDVQLVDSLLDSTAARKMKRRAYNVPVDCASCEHYDQCEGGCMREAVLYNRGLGGKYYYCESWKMVFKRIKESIRTGEVEGLINSWGEDFQLLQERALRNIDGVGIL